jgi:hypothetical protein
MGVQESHELAQLETRRQKLRAELGTRASARDDAIKAHDAVLCKLQAVEKSIETLLRQAEKPVVTEHAMLRYLEQVHGLDLEALQKEILSDTRVDAINTLKTCRLPLGAGNQVLVVEKRAVRNVVAESRKTSKTPAPQSNAKPAPRGPKPAQRRRESRDEGPNR